MAAVSQILPGVMGGLYLNSGTYTVPVWTDQLTVKDVKPTAPWDYAEASARDRPVKMYVKTLMDMTVQVVMRADPADAVYAAWVAAHWSRTATFDLLILNAKIATEGACGMRADFLVSMSDEAQEIGGTVFSTFDCKPTKTANLSPRYVLIGSGGTPSYTAITY